MQRDLDANYPQLDIQLLGVNNVFSAGGNIGMTDGRDIPWLQDDDANGDGDSDVWAAWNVTYRDVIILDGENRQVGVYNLTIHDLYYPQNYATLRQMLVDAATVPEPGTIFLLLAGAAGLAGSRCRRRTSCRTR